ncbi:MULTISPECIES: hypothetical protein [unclassified Pseudomonas]|uniref:hypothetical protein n=1 Tax=unclassified Pseudomonas TaxID=196821 RepID=UPI00244959C9|nr:MULTISPECIES: hypothetical protein [unclassified Pseudomonas]MDG9925451.1 hypothetical protein [Pseudomonas sp. GD04045]MDH0034108.1 hypothetical protein [Pseudomonas sp. GD04019]
MIAISDRIHVAADQIAMVEVPDWTDGVIVRLKDGERYSVDLRGRARFARADELVQQIDAELAGRAGAGVADV